MKKVIVIVILVLLAGLVSYRAFVNYRAKAAAMNKKPVEKVIPVRAVLPQRQEISEKIRASGTIQAETEVMIYPKVNGKIIRNLVQMGSPVKKGDVVSIINRDEVGYQYKSYELASEVNGAVSRIMLNPGATVSASTPILAIVNVGKVKAVVAVDELKIRFVKIGTPVHLSLPAYPDEAFAAKVSAISPIANPQTRTIDVEITIPNPGYRIKPGMYAEMEMIQSTRVSLVLPVVSVVDRGGRKYVFSATDGVARMLPVTTGTIIAEAIEIVSGLKGDELVVSTGADRLEDGSRINVVGR
jgi:multidrug efflux pump subunit AcrA (membrane-fusion protein)